MKLLASWPTVAVALGLAACTAPPPDESEEAAPRDAAVTIVRIATFNVWELGRDKLDQVDAEGRGTHPQLRGAAEIVQRLRPDVLLINEIDYDEGEQANARLLVERYFRVPQDGLEPIDYPHVYFGPVNTGVRTGVDMNRNGESDDPEDAFGFGHYPGQYGMALLSRFPIDAAGVRTFQKLLWRDQPGNLMPDGQDGKPAFYGDEQAALFRLSSKSHWDVPVRIGEATLHVLAAHPTPMVFDAEEDRNGRRCFDEIRLWSDYLSGGEAAAYLVDDAGRAGGLGPDATFVVVGDLNADPFTDEAPYGTTAIGQLLDHPRIRDPQPRGPGGVIPERPYPGPAETRTSSWGRIDYVLPSRDLTLHDAGVFWPAADDPLYRLVADRAASSDHRLVWIDVAF